MKNKFCVIDLSATEIMAGVFVDGQFQPLVPNLTWNIGFRQESNGNLIACFDDRFNELDSNKPNEVRFPDLDLHLQEVIDNKALDCFLKALFEEIFKRLSGQFGSFIDAEREIALYIILPCYWSATHRVQLRKTLRFNFPQWKLSACFNQLLCVSIYARRNWIELFDQSENLSLLILTSTKRDLILNKLACYREQECDRVELQDVLRYPDHFMMNNKNNIKNT